MEMNNLGQVKDEHLLPIWFVLVKSKDGSYTEVLGNETAHYYNVLSGMTKQEAEEHRSALVIQQLGKYNNLTYEVIKL